MNNFAVITLIGLVAVGGIVGIMWALPQYSVWQQEMSGRAALAKATQSRQIKVEEAKALKESAGYYAEAEIVRAKGVAEANKIIAQGLGGESGEMYIKYLWVNAMSEKENVSTVYIPVGQSGIPLMKDIK